MIEIKYGWGVMEINPSELLSQKVGIRAFRKLLTMSVESDRSYNTNAVEAFGEALNSEFESIVSEHEYLISAFKKATASEKKRFDRELKKIVRKKATVSKLLDIWEVYNAKIPSQGENGRRRKWKIKNT